MSDLGLIWIERKWDKSGYWLKLGDSTQHPNGKAVELHRYVHVNDHDSFDEIERILRSWGLKFEGMTFSEEESDRIFITIAEQPDAPVG